MNQLELVQIQFSKKKKKILSNSDILFWAVASKPQTIHCGNEFIFSALFDRIT